MREPYQKISHGVIPTLERLQKAEATVRDLNGDVDLPFSFAITGTTSRFDYLFPDLQTAEARLPELPETYAQLVSLGDTMREANVPQPDSSIPSAYTYFGQFVDHDITFEAKSDNLVKLSDPDFRVLTADEIRTKIANGRTPGLDLDNIYYKPAPRNCSRMVLGLRGLGNGPVVWSGRPLLWTMKKSSVTSTLTLERNGCEGLVAGRSAAATKTSRTIAMHRATRMGSPPGNE